MSNYKYYWDEIINPKPELVPYEGMLLSYASVGRPAYLYTRGLWTLAGDNTHKTAPKPLFETGVLVEFIPEPLTKKENQND